MGGVHGGAALPSVRRARAASGRAGGRSVPPAAGLDRLARPRLRASARSRRRSSSPRPSRSATPLVERLAREGHPWMNLRVETARTLALDLVGAELAREGLRLLSRAQALALVEQACAEFLTPGSYFGQLRDRPGFHRALQRTFEEIRAAGLSAGGPAARGVRGPPQAAGAPGRPLPLRRRPRERPLHRLGRGAPAGGRGGGAGPARRRFYLRPGGRGPDRRRARARRKGRRRPARDPRDGAARALDRRGIAGAARARRRRGERDPRGLSPHPRRTGSRSTRSRSSTPIPAPIPRSRGSSSREHEVPCTFASGVAAPFTHPGQAALAFLEWIGGRLRGRRPAEGPRLGSADVRAPSRRGRGRAGHPRGRPRLPRSADRLGRAPPPAALDRLIAELDPARRGRPRRGRGRRERKGRARRTAGAAPRRGEARPGIRGEGAGALRGGVGPDLRPASARPRVPDVRRRVRARRGHNPAAADFLLASSLNSLSSCMSAGSNRSACELRPQRRNRLCLCRAGAVPYRFACPLGSSL